MRESSGNVTCTYHFIVFVCCRWQCDRVPVTRWLHQSQETVLECVVPRFSLEYERLSCVRTRRESWDFEFRLSTRFLSLLVNY